MPELPLVSVIVPIYNVEAYLRQCLDSIVNQTYKQLEIILVNDGSTDSSGQICDEYASKDSRIKVITKPNGGLSSARNAGLKEAKGEFIYFVDSDDWIQSDTVETCHAALLENDADFCFFDADSFDESGYGIPQRYHRTQNYEPASGLTVISKLYQFNEFHSSIPLFFFQTAFLVKHTLSFFEGIVYEDMLFTFQAFALASKVCYVNHSFYQRRYRSNSIMTSRTTPLKFNSAVMVYEQLLAFIDNHALAEQAVASQYLTRSAFNVLNIYSCLKKADQKSCKKQLGDTKQNILKHNAFADVSLKMRCHGYLHWLFYKLYAKTIGRLWGTT